jgi:hypothetical protein
MSLLPSGWVISARRRTGPLVGSGPELLLGALHPEFVLALGDPFGALLAVHEAYLPHVLLPTFGGIATRILGTTKTFS